MAQLKLVSYNLDHSNKRQQLGENIRHFSDLGTQIFCLQEVRARSNEEFIGDYLLKKLGPDWRGQFFISIDSKNNYGLGFIWNTKILEPVECHNLSFPLLPKLTLLDRFIETFLSGDTRPVKRGGMVATFKAGTEIFRVSNVHLDWQGKFKQRFKQLQYLLEHLQASPTQNEIIAGDVNTVGFFGNGWQIKKIQALLGSDFVNFFPQFTLTTTHHQQLDHVFARNFQMRKAEVLRMPGSDHYPLVVEMDFAPKSKSSISVEDPFDQGVNRQDKQDRN
jgi:endonuclease/exonuclease/phosphatase family metal-dependent hydrolase